MTKASKKFLKETIKNLPKAKAKVKAKGRPKTGEQIADISRASNSFEGVKRIDHLPFEDQLNTVFNPLHTITKTTVGDTLTPSTFIVKPKK